MPPITNRQARSASAVAAGSPNRRTANLRVTPMEYGRIEYGGLPVELPHLLYSVVPHGISWWALGGRRISVVDGRPALQERAETLGFTALDPRRTRDWPIAPLTVDATGTPAGLRTVLKHTAPDGICSCVWSLHRRGVIPLAAEYIRNVTLHIGRAHIRTLIPEVPRSNRQRPIPARSGDKQCGQFRRRPRCSAGPLPRQRPETHPAGSTDRFGAELADRAVTALTYVVGDQTKAIASFFTL
jgi:hypothetical protein